MKTVVYNCPFVPCEWVAAHGLTPRRMSPYPSTDERSANRDSPRIRSSALGGAAAGVCPYARTFADSVCNDQSADAIVLTTVCDQMRRSHDRLVLNATKPVFLMNVPSTWRTPEAEQLYAGELKRLGRFLEGLGGQAPSEAELADVMLKYDDLRSRIRSARERVPPKRYSQMLLAIPSGQSPPIDEGGAAPAAGGIPIALVGGHLREHDFEVFDLIEAAGGRVVLDATDGGERTLPAPFDARRTAADPLATLADAYFRTIPHAFRRPNDLLYQYLDKELTGREVRAVVFRRYPWCDIWNAELQRMKDSLSIPVLDLDVGDDGDDLARQAGRIDALLEMLS